MRGLSFVVAAIVAAETSAEESKLQAENAYNYGRQQQSPYVVQADPSFYGQQQPVYITEAPSRYVQERIVSAP